MVAINRRTLVLAGLSASWPAAAAAALPTSDAVRAMLRQRIDEQKRAVGMVVGLVSADGHATVGHGRISARSSGTPDGDTVYRVASLTKQFTALLLADMVRRGEVGLDDPVEPYLGGIRVPPGRERPVTLADLATHTSGLPYEPAGHNSMDGYTAEDAADFLASTPLEAEPGTRWLYSNLGFAILGHALARRMGGSYGALLQARIAGPLGLRHTAIEPTAAMSARLAPGHDEALTAVTPRPSRGGFAAPAGRLHSTANDLCAFLGLFSGRGPSDLVASARLMPQTRRPAPPLRVQQGLGLQIRGQGPGALLTGEGVTLGYNAAFACDPTTGEAAVMVTNCAVAAPDIPRHIVRPRLYRLAPVYKVIYMPPEALDRYVGDYGRPQGGAIEVCREGGGLLVAIPGVPRMPISPLGKDEFVQLQVGIEFQFRVGAGGRVTGLVIRSAGQPDAVTERISPL